MPASTWTLCERIRHPPDHLSTSTETRSLESCPAEAQSYHACPKIEAFEHCCPKTCCVEPTFQRHVPTSWRESTQSCETSVCGTSCRPSNPATSTRTEAQHRQCAYRSSFASSHTTNRYVKTECIVRHVSDTTTKSIKDFNERQQRRRAADKDQAPGEAALG